MSNTSSNEWVGVIGAGSFGTALSKILAENKRVLLYARRQEVVEQINSEHLNKGQKMHENIHATADLEEVANRCTLIFPAVPSENFREVIQELAPFLKPYHLLLHATKGFDVTLKEGETLSSVKTLDRDQVRTMSEVISEETVVLRMGCVAGPNLARELNESQPAATVVASGFDEVIRAGQAALRTNWFRVHGNHDLMGIELAGVLKNIMAIASGMLHGLGYGNNSRALLVSRGLAEMIYVGKGLGADPKAFLGLAGVGDLVATCYSPLSRNFTVGYRLGKGESLDEILESSEEVAEGIKTIAIVRALADNYSLPIPITRMLYRSMFKDLDISKGVKLLMEYPFTEDVDFI